MGILIIKWFLLSFLLSPITLLYVHIIYLTITDNGLPNYQDKIVWLVEVIWHPSEESKKEQDLLRFYPVFLE